MINKKQEWEQSKKEWGFGRTKIDNFLDEKTVYELFPGSCLKITLIQKILWAIINIQS